MAHWAFYFFLKFGLYAAQLINFHWAWNLLLAVFVSLPLQRLRWRYARFALALPAALILFYYDSKLPAFSRVLSEAKNLAGFSPDYLLELLGRVVHPTQILALLAFLIVYLAFSRRLRYTSFVFVGIFCVPVLSTYFLPDDTVLVSAQAGDKANQQRDPNAQLEAFYAEERNKRVIFPSVAGAALPFDIIILHICSMSWDDFDFVGDPNPELFKRFDIVFSHFNSAASYSGPAAIRVLRGTCGQQKHGDLYQSAADACFVFPSLAQAGYTTRALMNHDGRYGEFASQLQSYGGIGVTPTVGDFGQVAMHSFDGSPIYEDFSVLATWWSGQRSQIKDKPVALYYNTITMHDGNKVPGLKSSSSVDTYKPRLTKLLGDFDHFISQLEKLGKPVVVMLIPEHGAALRGDKLQISGMREIPNPRVTQVPAAIKLVGFKRGDADAASSAPLLVNKGVSYQAVYRLLADFMADNPYAGTGKTLQERIAALPGTKFVSENDKIVVMSQGEEYIMRSPDGTWINYTRD